MQSRLFTSTAANPDEYTGHLPQNLYQYLQKHNLLDGSEHVYSREEAGKKQNFAISVKPEKIQLGLFTNSFLDAVVVKIACKDDHSEISYAFSKKGWYACMGISPEGYPGTSGNKTLCPFDGLSDSECRKQTPNQVKELVSYLSKIITPGVEEVLAPEPEAKTTCNLI